MPIEMYDSYQPHIDANKASKAPPSFNNQAQIKAFKRDISFFKKIKNKAITLATTLLKGRNTKTKQLSDYTIKKISSIEKQQEIDEYEPLTTNEANKNQPFKLDSATKNNILKRLKDKGFSATQAKNIFNTEFKKCNTYEDVDITLVDIPSVDIYKMGFSSETKMHNYLKDKAKSLINLGYDKEQSKTAILDAFNQSLTKKEFDNYLNSIPKYEDHNKDYSSPKEIQTIKQNATKHLLKQGYLKDEADDIVEEYYIKTEAKKDFLPAIKNVPKPAIKLKGYDTTENYLYLRNVCIDRLKLRLGYSHKKATKIAIEYQTNSPSRSEFMFKINGIHPLIK